MPVYSQQLSLYNLAALGLPNAQEPGRALVCPLTVDPSLRIYALTVTSLPEPASLGLPRATDTGSEREWRSVFDESPECSIAPLVIVIADPEYRCDEAAAMDGIETLRQ